MNLIKTTFILLISMSFVQFVQAQFNDMQFYKPNDKTGLYVYEGGKNDSVKFNGFGVRVGANLTQDFQILNHSNTSEPVLNDDSVNVNQLIGLKNGFNRAMANLNIDAQLEDGIRANLTVYLSSRYNAGTWFKGGYVQVDKMLFLKSKTIDRIMRDVTIKLGDYEVNYGDHHYRRTDGGNTIHNPFVENLILDAFTTEIGGEILYHPISGIVAMFGMTNGELNPNVVAASSLDTLTGVRNKYEPAYIFKLGFFKRLNADFRFRITASLYTIKSAANNTLYFGDRAGSHYLFVMENTLSNAANEAWSGRLDPHFNQAVTAYVINPFIKFQRLEFYGTYEIAEGRTIAERNTRRARQLAMDVLFRFPEGRENFWVGSRYNTVTAALPGIEHNVRIDRMVAVVGCFITKNIMVKAEYVIQEYRDFPITDIRNHGKFDGFVLEASVGF